MAKKQNLTEELNRMLKLAGVLNEADMSDGSDYILTKDDAVEFVIDEIESFNRQVGGFLPRKYLSQFPKAVMDFLSPEEIEEIYSDTCHSIAGH
jgi:hypothetical protein